MSKEYRLHRARVIDLPHSVFDYGNKDGSHIFSIEIIANNGDVYSSCPKQIHPTEIRSSIKFEIENINRNINKE